MRVYSFSEIPNRIPEIACIIKPGILPESGRLLILGDPEAGKTWLSLQTAYEIASGIRWLNYFPTQRSRVLHLALEDWYKLAAPRWSKLKRCYPGAEGYFYCASEPGLKLDADRGVNALSSLIEKYYIEVIIIDTYRAALTGDENPSEASDMFYTQISKAVVQVSRDYMLSIILVHHESKPTYGFFKGQQFKVDKGIHATRGSTDLVAKQDTVIELIRESDERDFPATMRFLKAKQARVRFGDFRLRFHSNTGTFSIEGGNTAAAIMEYLTQVKRASMQELEIFTQKSRPTVLNAVENLEKLDLVCTFGRTNDRTVRLAPDLME